MDSLSTANKGKNLAGNELNAGAGSPGEVIVKFVAVDGTELESAKVGPGIQQIIRLSAADIRVVG